MLESELECTDELDECRVSLLRRIALSSLLQRAKILSMQDAVPPKKVLYMLRESEPFYGHMILQSQ